MATTEVQFFLDPTCPWAWMTSRWLTEVMQHRDLEVRWRPFSLQIKNAEEDVPEPYAAMAKASHRALRVMEAVRQGEGEHAIAPLYTELGRRIHHDGDSPLTDLEGVLASCELDAHYVEAADDESWDETIRASMTQALEAVGDDVGTPILMLSSDPPVAYFGPVVSPPPTGQAALDLWDHLSAMAAAPSFYELKRSRTEGPQMGPRP